MHDRNHLDFTLFFIYYSMICGYFVKWLYDRNHLSQGLNIDKIVKEHDSSNKLQSFTKRMHDLPKTNTRVHG